MEDQCSTDELPALGLLPVGVLTHLVSQLPLKDQASCLMVARVLKEAASVALRARHSWKTRDYNEVSHMKASRLFRFLARYSPNLRHISCCFASDRLYGGSLLESSLSSLAAATPHITRLTLLNVDVTDAVLHHCAKHCTALQHIAIGRTENNAFGNFVSDVGLGALAAGCKQLSSLCLFRCYSCSDAGLRELVLQGRQIRSLVLHWCPQITSAGLVALLEATPELEQLDILAPENGPGTAAVNFDTCFALAANCHKLKVLRLSEELVSRGVLDDACLSVISRGCTALQALELVQTEVSDSCMSMLAKYCTQLTSIRLEQTYVGDEGIQSLLQGCVKLQELRVAGCSTHTWMLPAEYMFAGVSVSGFRKLADLAAARSDLGAQLTTLDFACVTLQQPEALEADAIAAAATAAASDMAALQAVHLVGMDEVVHVGRTDIDEDALNNMADTCSSSSCSPDSSSGLIKRSLLLFPQRWCNHLTSFSLDWLKADGRSLQAPLAATLSQCSNLSKLSLIGYQGNVDSLLVTVASTGAALQHLNLQHSQVTDAGLAIAAAAFPKLTSLYLCYCRNVGDQGLLQLLNLAKLEELDLYNTPCVSTAAVAKLARCCSALQRMYIGHSTSALHRLPAAAPAMGYINGSAGSNNNRYCGNSSGSVWSAVNEAATCRNGTRLAVLCRNPSSESEFEKRTLQALMGSSSSINA